MEAKKLALEELEFVTGGELTDEVKEQWWECSSGSESSKMNSPISRSASKLLKKVIYC